MQGLDELQCHLLLKRWLKDNGVNIPAPTAAGTAAGAAAAAGGAAPSALPTPAAAPGAAPAPAGGTAATSAGQAVLPADIVQGVADYYAQERIYLAKCQQFIVMTASECMLVHNWRTQLWRRLISIISSCTQHWHHLHHAAPADAASGCGCTFGLMHVLSGPCQPSLNHPGPPDNAHPAC